MKLTKNKAVIGGTAVGAGAVGLSTGLIAGHIPLIGAAFAAAATPFAAPVLIGAAGLAGSVVAFKGLKRFIKSARPGNI